MTEADHKEYLKRTMAMMGVYMRMTPEQTDATREAERRAKAWDDHLRAKLVYEEFDEEPLLPVAREDLGCQD